MSIWEILGSIFSSQSIEPDYFTPPQTKIFAPATRQRKTYLDERGYFRFIDSNKLVHRYVVEKCIGRELTAEEYIHHLDGNKRNNSPENLQICSWEDHNSIHLANKLFYGSWHKPKEA